MGSIQNHEWPSPENPNSQQRKIELLRREIEAVAKAVAVNRHCPTYSTCRQPRTPGCFLGGAGVKDAMAQEVSATAGSGNPDREVY
jgi:hypothetical protein